MPLDTPIFGFHNLEDRFDRLVDEVGVRVVASAIDEAVRAHNEEMDALLRLFTFRTTEFKIRFRTAGRGRLQPLDQDGRARPVKVAGQYEIGLPIFEAGVAWGANWKTRLSMTVGQANETTALLLMSDTEWVRDQLLAGLYAMNGWTFEDPEFGNLQVQGLANGDTIEYLRLNGSAGTDDHYLGQAAAIDNANDPFPIIHEELMEHPENNGDVIALVPTNLKNSVMALESFLPEPDSNIREGINTRQLIGTPGSVTVPGTFFGYHDAGVWLAEWPSAHDNRIVATTTGGDRPLAMREYEDARLRGFRQIAVREDHPFWEAQYYRAAGFGAWNRVGALIYQIGNADVTVPTGYQAPIF